jgi:hypothetical protein
MGRYMAEQLNASRKTTSDGLIEDKVICQYNPVHGVMKH